MSDLRTRDGGSAPPAVPLPGRGAVPAPLPDALLAALPADARVALPADARVALAADARVALPADARVALPADARVALAADARVALAAEVPVDVPVAPPADMPVEAPVSTPVEVAVEVPVEVPDDLLADRRDPRQQDRPYGRWVRWLRSHVADPYSRNAYPLILNTALTGVLGIGFWWLAPRYYSDADVGRGSALISVMTLLSGAVAINLTGTLNRFIPRAGRRTGRLVGGVYLLSSVVVAVLSAGFLLTLGRWGPTFDLLRDPTLALCFVPVVVAAGIFTLQDSVLTALRSSVWVPVENTCFGILKIVLLVLMAASFPSEGLFLSWVVAMALLVPPINALIFARLLPRHRQTTDDHVVPPTRAQIGGFFAGDYLGALFVFAAVYLVPVIVAADLAPDAFAHFYLVWTLVGILNLVGTNLATSLTVEGGYEAGRLAANCRAALRRASVILLVAVAVVALVAKWALGMLGPGYLSALPALLALACAALPRAVVEIWIGVLRAQGRTRLVARVQIATGVIVVGSVLAWLRAGPQASGLDRVTGVGVAVLASYTAIAVAVWPGLRRFVAESDGPRNDGPGVARLRVGRLRPPSPAVVAVAALTVVAVLGYLLSLRNVDLAGLTGLGLVSVLPVAALLSLAALALAFAITLSFRRPRARLLGAQVLATVCCLHGVAALIEPLPRFPTTWVHIGFIEYIGRTGTVLPDLDARFNWPGFFALVAFVTGKHDWPSLVGLMTWTPLVSNLLYLVAFGMLLRNLRASWRAKWFAAWLFCVLNWVGQDYLSPQGFSYLLYLLFIALLITWFRDSGPDPLITRSEMQGSRASTERTKPTAREHRSERQRATSGPSAEASESSQRRRSGPSPESRTSKPRRNGDKVRMLVPGELSALPVQASVRVTLLLLLVGVFVVATFTHQLTPFVMLAALTGLVVIRRCTATGLPWLLGVILAAYVSYLASVYWSGHFASLKAGLGDLIANLLAGTAGRAIGGSAEHHAVLSVRLALTVGVFVLAAVGVLRRRRRGVDDRVALVLLLAPLPLAVESYGGEMILRVYLFALPGACVLAAYAFFPSGRSTRRSWPGHLAAGMCAVVLVGGFLFARYGNEVFEITRPGELDAVQYLYQHRASPVLFLTDEDDTGATPFIPLGYQDVDRVRWTSIRAPSDPRDVDSVVAALHGLGPAGYLLTTRSQEEFLQSAANYPRDWGDAFRSHMREVPQVRVVAENADAVVYALRTKAKQSGPVISRGHATGVRMQNTTWSGVGMFFLVPLLVVLLTREVLRIRLGPGGRSRLQQLTLVAAPLFIVFVAVLIERLMVLTTVSSPGALEAVCDFSNVGSFGRGGDTDLLTLQRPSEWCLLSNH